MTDLAGLTIAEARDRMRKGDVASSELTEACIKSIQAAGVLNAFTTETFDIARASAKLQISALRG
jgi:aspartyl/glutamyl-tRNA(Asn/Gln) amidotransferase subunit A (EC 6.3.5.-)